MRKTILFLLLFLAFPAFGEVMVMSTGENTSSAQPAAAKNKSLVSAEADDEVLVFRPIVELAKYTICAVSVDDISIKNTKPKELLEKEAETSVKLPEKYTVVNHIISESCGVYYGSSDAAGKGLAVQAAVKDFGAGAKLQIRSKEIISSNRGDFNIKDKKPVLTQRLNGEGIAKKVISSPNKIKRLYNYAELPLSFEIQSFMDIRGKKGLPERLSVYTDASAVGVKGLAVVVFSETEKFLCELKDLDGDETDIYDIKPDFSYIYK